MRNILVLLVIVFISFNAYAAPRNADAVTDMMSGDYMCSLIEIDGSRGQKISIDAATHIEVLEIRPHFYEVAPNCGHLIGLITTLLQQYNCVTHPHPELDDNLNFVCRGTREEMVNLTADMYEHMQGE